MGEVDLYQDLGGGLVKISQDNPLRIEPDDLIERLRARGDALSLEAAGRIESLQRLVASVARRSALAEWEDSLGPQRRPWWLPASRG